MNPRYQPLTDIDQRRYDAACTGSVTATWCQDRYEIPEMDLYYYDGLGWLEYDENLNDGRTFNYADTIEFCCCEIVFTGGPRDGQRIAGV